MLTDDWKQLIQVEPPKGIEVEGYNKTWEDPDNNPDGICLCFKNANGGYSVAMWCNYHDEWHTYDTEAMEGNETDDKVDPPTHWKHKSEKPTL